MKDEIIIYRSEGLSFNQENVRCKINGKEMTGFLGFCYQTDRDYVIRMEDELNERERIPYLLLLFKFGVNKKPLWDYLKEDSYYRINIEEYSKEYVEKVYIIVKNVDFRVEYETKKDERITQNL